MPIELDLATLGLPPPPKHDGGAKPPSRLLILQNPGRMSRYSLDGVVRAAARLGIEHRVLEMEEVWQRRQVDVPGLTRDLADMIRTERIGAVLGYTMNGACDAECFLAADGKPRSLFDALGIPHLMLWIDHPQWSSEKIGLSPDRQPILRSPNNHHFLKSEAAAVEIKRVLGWANCYGLPVGEDPELVSPDPKVQPEIRCGNDFRFAAESARLARALPGSRRPRCRSHHIHRR